MNNIIDFFAARSEEIGDVFFFIAMAALIVSFASLIAGGLGVSWGHSVSGVSLLVFFNAMIFSHH